MSPRGVAWLRANAMCVGGEEGRIEEVEAMWSLAQQSIKERERGRMLRPPLDAHLEAANEAVERWLEKLRAAQKTGGASSAADADADDEDEDDEELSELDPELDPEQESTDRKPFNSLSVYVGVQQDGRDVRCYAAGVMEVNRRVVPNLIVFDASGIAGDQAGKGTLWLAGHFEEKRLSALQDKKGLQELRDRFDELRSKWPTMGIAATRDSSVAPVATGD